MEIMLDTNICIYIIKEKPRSVLQKFSSFAVGALGISVITLAELEYGVSKSNQPTRNSEALQGFISPLEIAVFDRQATTSYGKIGALLEKRGQTIGSMDLLIAAHALSLGVRLATNNIREFKRIPNLRVENWV